MKMSRSLGVFKFWMVVVLSQIATGVFAQENRIWTKIQNFNALNLQQVENRLSSDNVKLNQLISNHSILSIHKAVPSSKMSSLQDLYEIDCNCDANDLLVEIARMSDLFIKPEIGPNYQTLQGPDDINLAFSFDYALHLVKAPEAWEITRGDSSIRIAISDAGYIFSHPELLDKVDVVSSNIVQSNTAHGTAVAIAAAGATNNSYGKSSIGYNSRLELRGMNYNELLEASYAGARIVNASWAAGCFYSSYGQDIINEIYNNGTVIIAAAGNGSTCGGPSYYVYPAAFDHVISVTSIGPSNNHERTIGNPETTHQHNDKVDICAPGYDVALSTSTNVFTTGNGTSFAAPMVSGAAALILAVNPCLTPDDVEFILKNSADTISNFLNPAYAGLIGAGRLDVDKAVRLALQFNTMSAEVKLNTVCDFNEQYFELQNISGQSPFSIQWSNGDSGMIGLIGAPGEYSVLVKDSLGCLFSYKSIVEAYTPIALQGDLDHVSCFGFSDGSVSLDISGGSGVYVINWSNGAETNTLYDMPAGYYHVTVADEFGCTKTESFELVAPQPLVVDVAITHPNEFELGAVEVNVTGGTPEYSFSWSNGMSSDQLLGLDAGIYQVTVVDANGCASSKLALLQQQTVAGITSNTELTHNLYPNPATEKVTIDFASTEIFDIYLINSSGQAVDVRFDQVSTTEMNVSTLSNGIYYVEMRDKKGGVIREKLVVQH